MTRQRISKRDTILEQNRTTSYLEAMYGDRREAKGLPAPVMAEVPRLRNKGVRKPMLGGSEAQILAAIMVLLKHHPKVARAWRINSGQFEITYNGKSRYVRANTARGMADIGGLLKPSGRSLYIEVKSAKGIIAPHQQEFLDSITKAGGLAFVARSVDDVVNKLKGA